MPLNGTEIWVADVVPTSGSFELKNPRHVAGEHGKISVAYPTWTSNDTILFTCDASGFENPWSYDCTTGIAKPMLETSLKFFGGGSELQRSQLHESLRARPMQDGINTHDTPP
ncbi:hypothetical protein B0H14DRAFT_3498177 [Mycena olivaceomarginata]|nr:hypothetical protein B0H14DRAFT_3498177 [Mycena olivaceomarginata]